MNASPSAYKATRPDGTSFYDSKTKWTVGRITRHPAPNLTLGTCSNGVLHASIEKAETLISGWWPCRLFEVESRGPVTPLDRFKFGCGAFKVVRELPAWEALGPNGEAVVAVIERAEVLTATEANQLWGAQGAAWGAAWYAAVGGARYAARDARGARGAAWDAACRAAQGAAAGGARYAARGAWDAAWGAAWEAAQDSARVAALAELTRDLITPEQYQTLAGPWLSVVTP